MSGLKSPKKKFFDDDDFFVIKKAKKLKSVDSPKPEQHPQPKNKERSQLPIISQIPSDEATPNNNLQQFYSADEFLPTPVEDLTTTRDIASLLQTENKPQQENTIDIVDDDSELKDFFSHISKDSQDDEHNRLYRVKVISKIEPFYVEEQVITGNCTFAQLLEQLLARTFKAHRKRAYWASGALVWIEGKTELKPFFKPKTLRISPPVGGGMTPIRCLYIPVADVGIFESVYPEFKTPLSPENADQLIIEVLDEDELGRNETDNSSAGYFVIGLKGKDNKKIEVEVNSQTRIRKLLEHYLTQKGIHSSQVKNPRLVFDSEELCLDNTVGDTELEEDFEVEVYL